jgi:Ca2+-binding EF-hand superfamily protein
MRNILLAAGAVAIAAWAAPALTQAAAPVSAQPGKAMKSVTRAQVAQEVQQHFARLDADRDGFVTQAEAQALAGQRSPHVRQRTSVRRDPAEMFARFDTNRDGQITRAEADAAHAAMVADARRKRADGLFERADANRDGVVSRAEFDAAPAQKRQRVTLPGAVRAQMFGGRMFAMADADKDGRVSLAEATAVSMRQFDSSDANRDGVVTPDERRLMRQQHRGAAPRG